MYSEALVSMQVLQHLVRYTANAHLQCGLILDERCNVLPYLTDSLRSFGGVVYFWQLRLVPYQAMNFAYMQKTVTMCAGHFGIYLRNDQFGGIYSSPCNVYRGP